MRIKLDENMPLELADILAEFGHDVHSVHDEGLDGSSDDVIGRVVRDELRFLITQDKGFADIRNWIPDPGAGVMLVRIPEDTREMIIEAVVHAFRTEPVETWVGKHVKLNRNRVRVQPLQKDS